MNYNAMVHSLEYIFSLGLVKQQMNLTHGMDSEGRPVISVYPANIHVVMVLQSGQTLVTAQIVLGDGGDTNSQEVRNQGMGELSMLKSVCDVDESCAYTSEADVAMTILSFCIAFERMNDLKEVILKSSNCCPF
jgi:hypothetical protein